MKYRADIDGLRALAVVPVVLFHAGYDLFSGGFVGVDVFFVISGYLITAILLDELREGRFSVAAFYKRRVLRIFPALFVMVALCAAVAYQWMLPGDFEAFGRSVVATALFSSNILFWKTTGYFENPSNHVPLLHTWSLAVEEQFYIVLPLLLWVLYRLRPARIVLWLAIAAACSFALSVIGTAYKPWATFYLLPTRFWELALGSLVAAGGLPQIENRRWRDGLAFAGAAAILYAVFALRDADPFPGWNALYPCVGAALLIGYGKDTLTGNLLATRPFTAIGLISYSLYLWHWPVFAFYKLRFIDDIEPAVVALLVVLSFALAVLSYRFVETPFRERRYRAMKPRAVLGAGFAGLAAFVILGAGIDRLGTRMLNYPKDALRLASFVDYRNSPDFAYQFRPGVCMINAEDNGFSDFDKATCLNYDPGRPNYLVIGDSHAGHIWRAFANALDGANVMQATASGCRPTADPSGSERCTSLVNYVYRDFLPTHRLAGIILAARWQKRDVGRLKDTVELLKRYADRVIVLGPTVEYKGLLPNILAQMIYRGENQPAEYFVDGARKELDLRLRAALEGTGATYVSVHDIVCPAGRCMTRLPDGDPVQFDYGHFTLKGATAVVEKIKAADVFAALPAPVETASPQPR